MKNNLDPGLRNRACRGAYRMTRDRRLAPVCCFEQSNRLLRSLLLTLTSLTRAATAEMAQAGALGIRIGF
jgi:hypothetical protein